MNILIGLAILLTLMLSENSVQEPAQNVMLIFFGLLALTAIAPLVASVQVFLAQRTSVQSRSFEEEISAARKNSSIHAAIWIFSSVAIVCILRWQNVIRSNWELDRFIAIDEMLILLPMLISLLVSWAIFFEQHSHSVSPANRFAARLGYVGLRCRVYLIVVLIPIAFMILLKDLWPYYNHIPPAVAGIIAVIAIAILLSLMPFVISMMWSHRSIKDEEGRQHLLDLCHAHKMSVNDIRIWDTGHQIVNALVAGLIPRLRILMVSDLLLSSFPDHELRAVLRHEAGHVRLRHLPIRIAFILLPAVAMASIELDPNKTLAMAMDFMAGNFGLAIDINLLLGLTFVIYVLAVTAWLSKNMEFEADLYAIGAFLTERTESQNQSPVFAQSMSDALLRFGEQNPDQFSRRSMTHPSLFDRIEMIKAATQSPEKAEEFRRKFSQMQISIALGIATVTVAILIF